MSDVDIREVGFSHFVPVEVRNALIAVSPSIKGLVDYVGEDKGDALIDIIREAENRCAEHLARAWIERERIRSENHWASLDAQPGVVDARVWLAARVASGLIVPSDVEPEHIERVADVSVQLADAILRKMGREVTK